MKKKKPVKDPSVEGDLPTQKKKKPEKVSKPCPKCEVSAAAELRALADYQNLQRETALQRIEFVQYANQELIEELLPTLDYFDAAMNSLPKLEGDDTMQKAFDSWILGIKQVQKLMMDTLANKGVSKIDVDIPFDANIHEAIEEQESDEPEGAILKVITNGYKLNDKLLRPAKVVVSKAK